MKLAAQNSIHLNLKADHARLTRAVSALSSCLWGCLQAVDRWKSVDQLVHLRFAVRLARSSKDESRPLLVRRERSLRSLVHAAPVDGYQVRLRAQREPARSSRPGGQPAYNRPRRGDPSLLGWQRALSPARASLSTCCGVVHRYGSSSSLSTRGVGRCSGLPLSLWEVIGKLCLTFKLLSMTTTSFSEMLVTRNLPASRSPRWTFTTSLLAFSWRIAVSINRGVPMMPI